MGTAAPPSAPATHVLVRSVSFSRELGSRPHSPPQTRRTFLLSPPVTAGALPRATRSGHAALRRDTAPCHQVVTPTTHQNNRTCSAKRLQNTLNPYLPLGPHLSWAGKKRHFTHQKSSSMSSSLYWGPESTLGAALVKLIC